MKVDWKQLQFLDKKIRRLLTWLKKETGITFTMTSIYRIGDRGVHGTLPVRGIDLRMRNFELGKTVEELINDSWAYDPKRPEMNCALIHGEGQNMHLHLQVHPNTILIEKEKG